VGAYEDLILEMIEAVLPPGRRMTTEALVRLVPPRVAFPSKDERYPQVDVLVITVLLRASPNFVEVEPGVWMRREDRPEAGVPSRLRRPPFAGGAAAAATPPERHVSLDVVGGEGGKATIAAG
jgi:hypothetical protein